MQSGRRLDVARIGRWVIRGALGVLGLSALVVGLVWLRVYSPFQSHERLVRSAFTDCAFGDGMACAELVRLYQVGCDQDGDCLQLAASYRAGRWVPQDLSRAARIYAESCDRGEPFACFAHAAMLEKGRGVPRQRDRAVERYARACDLRLPSACSAAGAAILDGSPDHGDRARAVGFFERGCKLGDPRGCYGAGAAYAAGAGAPRDRARAEESLRLACDRKLAPACGGLGHLLVESQDASRAEAGMTHLATACAEDDAAACLTLGRAYLGHPLVRHDVPSALGALDRACRLGVAAACQIATATRASAQP
jgi:TPR repeat protein